VSMILNNGRVSAWSRWRCQIFTDSGSHCCSAPSSSPASRNAVPARSLSAGSACPPGRSWEEMQRGRL